MRRSISAAIVAVGLAVGVVACSPGVEDRDPPSTTMPAETGSPGSQEGATGGSTDTVVPTDAPVVLPEDLDEQFEELGLNERGNQPVAVEDPAEFMEIESGAVFATITATSIEPGFTCTAPGAYESINGQFVALTFDVDVADSFAQSGFPSLSFSVHEFHAWDADGARIVDPVGNAEACIDAGDRVSTPLNPGENSRGLVILDVPEGPGSAAFVVGGFQGSYGWEWRW